MKEESAPKGAPSIPAANGDHSYRIKILIAEPGCWLEVTSPAGTVREPVVAWLVEGDSLLPMVAGDGHRVEAAPRVFPGWALRIFHADQSPRCDCSSPDTAEADPAWCQTCGGVRK